ncbi:MAG: hypothetical protein O3B86_12890 [Planctomycetota bacterium]|nr:hypothetical protein [Planctomycetota bacterium]
MPVLLDLSAKVLALCMIGARIAIFLVFLPQHVVERFGEGFGSLIGCSLGVAGYAYSVFVNQRVESRLFYHADWHGAATLLRQRFCVAAWRWHLDLLRVCLLSGLFGAGVGWNLCAMTDGNLTDARIIAVISMVVPFSVVFWIYRGTTRYCIDLPVTES